MSDFHMPFGGSGRMSARLDAELSEMALEELDRACTLRWRDLRHVTPWGDTSEAFTPSGRPVLVERNYLWSADPGGDILVEIVVFESHVRYEDGAGARRLIRAEGR